MKMMKKTISFFCIVMSMFFYGQSKKSVKKPLSYNLTYAKPSNSSDLVKSYDEIPDLIPKRVNGRLGYVNQNGKMIIQPEYKFGTFFWEDCNLLNSPNENVRKFGSNEYASVTIGETDYRIDKLGRKVYTFKQDDLGKCNSTYRKQIFSSYTQQGFYGLVDVANFHNPNDYKQFKIYPQYQYLHVLESEDLQNPMIIVSQNDLFGIIDVNGKVIIPLEYADIKRNFSWKMANMFEVSKDGNNYYFIDDKNRSY